MLNIDLGFTSNFELIVRNDSICPGSTLVYECNATRGGLTVFHGSAFNCPSSSNELVLFHNHNYSNRSRRTCNDGAIVAETTTGMQDDIIYSYSSRLTITLNDNVMALNEIICSFDDGSTEWVIGRYYIPEFNEIGLY